MNIVQEIAANFFGGLAILVILTIVMARAMGVTLFRACPKCGSRQTQSYKGWIMTLDENDYDGWKFVEDIECWCCAKRTRFEIPQENWPEHHCTPCVS